MAANPMTEDVFGRWAGCDARAREQAAQWLKDRFFKLMLHLKRGDEDRATDLFVVVFLELEKKAKLGSLKWPDSGEKGFEAFVRRLILYRYWDEVRRELAEKRKKKEQSLDESAKEGSDDALFLIDALPSRARSAEDVAFSREFIAFTVKGILLLFPDYLRSLDRKALAETVEAMVDYVIKCLKEACPPPGPASLDDLLERFDPGGVQFDKTECYQFMMEKMGIGRNTLDQRLKQMRELFVPWAIEKAIDFLTDAGVIVRYIKQR